VRGEWPETWLRFGLAVACGLLISVARSASLTLAGVAAPLVVLHAPLFALACVALAVALLRECRGTPVESLARGEQRTGLPERWLLAFFVAMMIPLGAVWTGPAWGGDGLADASLVWILSRMGFTGNLELGGYSGGLWGCMIPLRLLEALGPWFCALTLTTLPLWGWLALWNRWVTGARQETR
jgi:hypothetical protein